jgi:hypothetical protein
MATITTGARRVPDGYHGMIRVQDHAYTCTRWSGIVRLTREDALLDATRLATDLALPMIAPHTREEASHA